MSTNAIAGEIRVAAATKFVVRITVLDLVELRKLIAKYNTEVTEIHRFCRREFFNI